MTDREAREAKANEESLLCDLTVAADSAMATIVGAAYALFYHREDLSKWQTSARVRDIRLSLDKLREAFEPVDKLYPEKPILAPTKEESV